MKILLFAAAIAAALGTVASACPIEIDGSSTVTTRDAKIRGNVGAGVKMIMLPPQTGIPKRDLGKSTSGSMTVRWNTQPAAPLAKATARIRMTPALPPFNAVI